MSGFALRKSLKGPIGEVCLLEFIGKNSIAFQVGDLVRLNTSGFLDVVDATESIVGVVAGVVDNKGIRVDPDSGTLDTYTMPSANQTAATRTRFVQVIPALPEYLWYNDASTTLTQAMVGAYFDTTDENDVAVGGVTDTWSAQVQLIALDPDGDGDASKGLFRIVESQIGAAVSASRGA